MGFVLGFGLVGLDNSSSLDGGVLGRSSFSGCCFLTFRPMRLLRSSEEATGGVCVPKKTKKRDNKSHIRPDGFCLPPFFPWMPLFLLFRFRLLHVFFFCYML